MLAIAALVRLFPEEVSKPTPAKKTVKASLVCDATPAKYEWFQNGPRYRRTLSEYNQVMLPTGSTSNEAFHAECNKWLEG